jgi:hypothetical protein
VATRTSTQSGNWSDTATWGGSAAPVDGDTATISTGHTVTVDVNATVGINGIAANHLTLNGTAAMTIAEDVTFTLRGYAYCNSSGALTMQPGSVLDMVSTGACRCHLASTQARAVFNGTAAKPCTVKKGGSGASCITGGGTTGGLHGQYVVFSGLADASGYAINNKALSTNGGFDLQYVLFDGCGKNSLSAAADGKWSLQNVTEKNNAQRDFIDGTTVVTAATTGARVMKNCVIQKFINLGFSSMAGFVITGNVFRERFFEGHGDVSEWSNNLVYVSKKAY